MVAPAACDVSRHAGSRLFGMQRLISQGWTAGCPPGNTRSTLHQLPAGAIGVRFELANKQTDGAVTYNAVYALSGGVNDWFTPLNAAGMPDNTLWVTVTAEGSASMTVPAAAAPNQPARLLTDVMPFTRMPPARIDGGLGICLFFRLCSTAGKLTYHDVDGTVGLWNGYHNGQHPDQFSQTFGGSWSNPANNCIEGNRDVRYQSNNLSPMLVPHAVLPMTATPTLTIMSVGDSILSGGPSPGVMDAGVNGAGLQLANMLDRPTRPALHVNDATSGMTTSDYIANAVNSLAIMVPDVVLLQTYSANDTGAAGKAAVWNAWQRTMVFASLAVAAGSTVILVTSPPFCGIGSYREAAVWEASRLCANEFVKNSGMPYLDSDAIIGAAGHPVGYRPGCSNDFVHPNALASTLLASAAAALLSVRGVR
jgi:hypothetical protein